MVTIQDLSSDPKDNVSVLFSIKDTANNSSVNPKVFENLHKMFYEYGPGDGTFVALPFDQLVEHGFAHKLNHKTCGDPRDVISLGNKGNFSCIAIHIGLAEKYRHLIKIPLLVKLDGHQTLGPNVSHPRHSTFCSVKRAVAAGADAVGLTMYVGGEQAQEDTERIAKIIEEAHQAGLPVVLWAYARGPLPKEMGEDSLYWCCQGISMAESLGADVVKQKFPKFVKPEKMEAYKKHLAKDGMLGKSMPSAHTLLELEPEDESARTDDLVVKRISLMAQSAPATPLIISGGAKSDDFQGLVDTTKLVMDAGGAGRIIGRSFWGFDNETALGAYEKVKAVMQKEEYKR